MSMLPPKPNPSKRKSKFIAFKGISKVNRFQRRDIKYPTDKIRKREERNRKRRGYYHSIFIGTQAKLIKFLGSCVTPYAIYKKNLLSDIKTEVELELEITDFSKPGKMDAAEFRLYLFKRNREDLPILFELFLKEAKFEEVEIASASICRHPSGDADF